MDQAGKYEQLIGEKLEQIPLPDLVESIWARIETELDSDTPDAPDSYRDDGDGPDNGPTGGIFWRKGLFVLIGALIMTFFFYPKNQKQNIESNIVLPANESINIENKSPDESPPPSIERRPNGSVQLKQQSKDSVASAPPVFPQVVDLTPVKLDDSVKVNANVPALVITPPPVVSDSVGKKKLRGVKVNDDDYKIVPKKER